MDGTASEPRAKRIEFTYNSSLIAIPDTRPGKTDPWHKKITPRVTLRVVLGDDQEYEVDGYVNFYLVRGDSALIPQDIKDRLGAAAADAGRWYIERWEDNTGGSDVRVRDGNGELRILRWRAGVGAFALGSAAGPRAPGASPADLAPAIPVTWGELLRLYRTSSYALRR